MFASLGTISFQVIASPTKFERSKKYHFQKIDVIGAPPVLQWTGDDLKEIDWSITLHQLWCNPTQTIESIEKLAEQHAAQALVLGSGYNVGNFVISEFKVKQLWQATDGTVIAAECQLQLTEFIPSALPQGAPPQPATVGNPPAIVTIANSKPAVVDATDSSVAAQLTAFTQAQASAAALAYEGVVNYDFAIETAQLTAFGLSLFASPATASPSGIPMVEDFTSIALPVIARWGN